MPAPLLPLAALIRPTSLDDPSLAMGDTLAGLLERGQVSGIVVAAPQATPEPCRAVLRDWARPGLEVDLDGAEAPQERLARLFRERGWEAAVVVTAYCRGLEPGQLARAVAEVASGALDAAVATEVVPASWFAVVSRRAALALAEQFARTGGPPLPPHLFGNGLRRAGLAVGEVPGSMDPAERFLREAFETEAEALLADAGLRQELARPLADLHDAPVRLLAAQVKFLRRLLPALPEGRERVLELGCGSTPLASALLAGRFREGLALDPFTFSERHLRGVLELARVLSERIPDLGNGPEGTLRVLPRRLEEAGVADGSVDFLFSRSVLEHAADVQALSRECRRVLRPGGAMLHLIDFRDHEGDPDEVFVHFSFLRHSREEWAGLGRGTNLWRVNDYVELWRSLGFDVEVLERRERVVPPERLHPSWRSYAEKDLYCHVALVRAVKSE